MCGVKFLGLGKEVLPNHEMNHLLMDLLWTGQGNLSEGPPFVFNLRVGPSITASIWFVRSVVYVDYDLLKL